MAEFIELPLITDGQTLTDNAIAALQIEWPDYTPNDGDPEVVLLEAIGDMAEEVATDAARMPVEALAQYGFTLLGLQFGPGVPATGEVTFTAIDSTGYTIDAGFEIDIDGFVFMTDDDAVIPAASTEVAGVPVTAVEPGSDFNDLTGANVDAITSTTFVDSITLDAPTANGTDQETQEEYLDRISRELTLRGRTLVTWRDYEEWALDFPSVIRAVAIGNTARMVRVILIGDDGLAVDTDTKNALEALYTEFQQVNTTYNIEDAAYWAVSLTVSLKAYPGYDLAALEDTVEAVIAELLSPLTYGKPKFILDELGQSQIPIDPVIRKNKIIDAIGDIEGVDYVYGYAISTTTTKAVTATAATNLVHRTNHGLQPGYAVKFTGMTGGAGIGSGSTFYVIASGLTADDFKISATQAGSELDITSDMSAGTMTPVAVGTDSAPWVTGDLALPGIVALPTPGTITVDAT